VRGEWAYWLTLAWFMLTYVGLALGRLPGLRIDRAGIALVGAALLLATGVMSFEAAVRPDVIDFATIALLLGMMIVVAFLRLAGFFDRLAGWALQRVRTPRGLLAVTMGLSGVLSAVLVNDVVCVALTPLVLHLARKLRLDARPHLIGLALAANIGSTATPTGNPQNMIIGNVSHIPYLRFAAVLTPVALGGLVIAFLVVCRVYRSALQPAEDANGDSGQEDRDPEKEAALRRAAARAHRRLLIKSVVVTLGAVAGFLANLPMSVVALAAAAVLLLGRVNPRKVYAQVDWGLLVMFCGLFVVVHAFEVNIVRRWAVEEWGVLHEDPIGVLSLISAGLSNLVSNVPAVLLFKPVVPAMPAGVQETVWLALAMSSTLAGNLTVLGSVANLIVVESARREGVAISFWDYARVGIPVTALTLAAGVGWLCLGLW
jgi:Na+/H+ antiporter NhaD/arsenite permease-like protein